MNGASLYQESTDIFPRCHSTDAGFAISGQLQAVYIDTNK